MILTTATEDWTAGAITKTVKILDMPAPSFVLVHKDGEVLYRANTTGRVVSINGVFGATTKGEVDKQVSDLNLKDSELWTRKQRDIRDLVRIRTQ